MIYLYSETLSFIELIKVAIFSILVLYVTGSSSMKLLQHVFRRNLSELIDGIFENDVVLKFNFFLYVGIIATLLLCEPMILLGIFGTPLLYVSFIFFLSFFIFDLVKQRPLRKLNVGFSKTLLHMVLLFIVLAIVLFDRWNIIAGVYGPIGDDVRHTGVVWAIAQNKFFTITPSSLNGVYALTASLATLCQVPIYEAGLIFSTIFSMLIFLGFYSLGVTHIRHFLFGYLCAFVGTFFWLDSSDPIAWGGYPLLLSFYLTLSAMAFSKKLFDSDCSFRKKIVYLVVLFIPLYGVYPISILYVSVWLVLLSIYDGFLVKRNYHSFLKSMVALVFANLTSVFLNILYLYHPISHILSGGVSYGTVPSRAWGGMSLTKVNDLLSLPFSPFYDPQNYTVRLLSWFTIRPGSFDLIPYGIILSLIILLVTVWKEKVSKEIMEGIVKVSKAILVYYFLIVILYLYIKYVDQYLYIIFPSERVMESEGIFLTMMQALSIALYWGIFSFLFLPDVDFTSIKMRMKKRAFSLSLRYKSKIEVKPLIPRLKKMAPTIASFFIFLLIFFSLISINEPINANSIFAQKHLLSNYFLTEDDIILQSWIDKNITANSCILILPVDGGFNLLYSTSKKIVGSIANYIILIGHNKPDEDFVDYTRLLTYLTTKPDDETTLALLRRFNVKYIYVGAYKNLKCYDSLRRAAQEYGFPDFDFKSLSAETLENLINYEPIKKVGNAAIFEVTNASFQILWKEDSFKENWSFASAAGRNVTCRWITNGDTVQLTVGGNYTPNRVWYLKNLNINLTEQDYMVIRVKGSPNARFLVQGIDKGKVLIGSSDWEKCPLNWTTYTYRVRSSVSLEHIVVGAFTEDGNTATVYFEYILLGRKVGAHAASGWEPIN